MMVRRLDSLVSVYTYMADAKHIEFWEHTLDRHVILLSKSQISSQSHPK